MFSLPQPPTAETELIDGCPVIDVHDDPEDVVNLVKVIYDGPTFTNNDRQEFTAVCGFLRLANKYFLEDSIRSRVLDHLRVAWPSTLKGWDAREDLARAHEIETGMLRGHRFANPIAVINLAHEIGADDLLPAAFYDLSRYSYTQIFEPNPGEPLHPDASPPSSSPSFSLSHIDIQRLALGKESAQQAIATLIQNMENASPEPQRSHPRLHRHSRSATKSSNAPCVTPAACRKDLYELVELAKQHYLMDRERGCADPLYVAEELGQLKSAEFSDCTACARDLELWAARERERLWKAIPGWFRLPVGG